MEIIVNGEKTTCDERISIENWVEQMGYDKKKIAIEVNGEIVPKAEYASYTLGPADKLEVVTFVGGG